MLAFVDESGDTGRKILNRSSRYFVVAVVVFRDNDDAHACDAAIKRLRGSLNLPARYEFHYAENSLKVKEAFLRTVSTQRFEYFAFVIDKRAAESTRLEATVRNEGMYKFAIRRAFEIARPQITSDVIVSIDRSGGRQLRNEIASHLRRHITNDMGHSLIADVKLHRSSGNELIQLADYVSGITNRALRGNRREIEYQNRYLLPHEGGRAVWP